MPFATSAAGCSPCKPGRYSSTPGADECTLCPAGTNSSAVGATTSLTCTPCPAGTFASEPGGLAACLPCLPGYTSEAPKSAFYDDSLANMSVTSLLVSPLFNRICARCKPGTTGVADATGSGVCKPCPVGYL